MNPRTKTQIASNAMIRDQRRFTRKEASPVNRWPVVWGIETPEPPRLWSQRGGRGDGAPRFPPIIRRLRCHTECLWIASPLDPIKETRLSPADQWLDAS